MKAKDIKPLCTWEERRPILEDKLFFVPKHFNEHNKDHLQSWNQLSNLCIEFCSGNGAWIIEKALQNKDLNFIAVEKRFDRVRKIVAKAKNLALSNLFTVWGEAFTFTRHYLSSECVEKIFINFPDPWPKRRHGKNRLIEPPFLMELSRVLKKGGIVTFVTDDQDYFETTLQLFLQNTDFVSIHPKPYYVHELEGYGSSYFENLWREKGRSIYYIQMQKK